MSRDIRAQVKSTYYDYTITLVEEIEQINNPLVYLVHLADASTWKIVSVCDGEMETVQDFRKG
jgi:hypothetical protein